MFNHSSEFRDALVADPLSQVLHDLRIVGVSYGRCELTKPWGIAFPAQNAARFHFVAAGDCWLHTEVLGWTQLHVGDVVFLPHGTVHELADTAGGHTQPLDTFSVDAISETVYQLHTGGGGAPVLLFCGSVSFEAPELHPLVELMPQALVVRGAATNDATLPMILDIMAGEIVAQRVGAATVMTRLADVVITRVIRAWVETHTGATAGWLAAIRDPHIGRALAAIHRRPGQMWSVAALATVAQSSRSMFSERFTAIVGVSPARYLTRWRMHLARIWLHHDRLTVNEVATRLGYESDAAFSRAFKRCVGVPPSATRRRTKELAAPQV